MNPNSTAFMWRIGQSALLICLFSMPAYAQSGTRTSTPTYTPRTALRTAPQTVPNVVPRAVPSGVPIARAGNGIAVVELFTSQGCSSCPPADDALRQIASVAEKSKLPVHVLSFHVDYWNRLGWDDPYSDELFTKRQQAYASAMKSSRVYTPQMIVNGTTEFVGSKKSAAHTAITRSLRTGAAVKVQLEVKKGEDGHSLDVTYALAGSLRSKVLNLAAVQTPDANAVPRGENSGRQLSHVNVVRAFQTLPIEQTKGSAKLAIPDDLDPSEVKLIAYVQDPRSLSIVGAAASTPRSK